MPIHFEAGTSQGVTYISFGGKLAEVVVPEAFIADVKVAATGGDTVDSVVSGNQAIAPLNPGSKPRLYGLGIGDTTLIATTAVGITAFLNVKVRARRDYGKTVVKLGDVPLDAHAIMDFGAPIEPVDMPTLHAEFNEKQEDLLQRIADTGVHKHLYFACHFIGGSLRVGRGIDNGKVFAPLNGKIKDAIWISGCAMLHAESGKQFARDIAKAANCPVVGATFGVPTITKKRGPNEIESFTEAACSVVMPDGTIVSENFFFRDRFSRNFKIVRLGAIPVK